jgi:hypothetical protein
MSQARTCGATFNATGGGGGTGPFTLTISNPVVQGGGGIISGAGIQCYPGNVGFCARTAAANTAISFIAIPNAGFSFSGWSGAGCSANMTITATMTCTAVFTKP